MSTYTPKQRATIKRLESYGWFLYEGQPAAGRYRLVKTINGIDQAVEVLRSGKQRPIPYLYADGTRP